VVEATSGTIDQQGRPFAHGFEIHLERATLAFDFAVLGSAGRMLCEPTLLDDKGRVKHPKLSDGDPMNAFQAELREILRAIRTGEPSPILDGSLARDAIVLCQKQTESLRQGRPVKVVTKKA
jgi:predicted dehydrogenase